MNIELKLDDANRTLPIDTAETVTVLDLIARIERDADLDGRSVVELALGEPLGADDAIKVSTLFFKHPHVQTRRQCVTIHFEDEEVQRKFPATAPWARVHQFACRHFDIARDACANLEIHLNAIDGPVANERKQIGHHEDCIDAWVVKPGPEPNGSTNAA